MKINVWVTHAKLITKAYISNWLSIALLLIRKRKEKIIFKFFEGGIAEILYYILNFCEDSSLEVSTSINVHIYLNFTISPFNIVEQKDVL